MLMVQGSSIQCWFVVGRVAMILILGDINVINKGCHVSAIQYVYVIYRSLPEIHRLKLANFSRQKIDIPVSIA